MLAVLILALPGLAGCISDADAPGVQLQASNDTSLDDLAMPDNRTGDFNAFEETNVTETGAGGVDHHHDYWLGRDRVEIFATSAMMDPRPHAFGLGDTPAPRYADVEFNMPPGALVFEGTSTLEFTVSNPRRHACDPTGATWDAKNTCTDGSGFGTPALPTVPDPAPPQLKLLYQHASSGRDEWTDAGPLTWGTPLVLALTPTMTDMPHATTSLWRYRVVSTTPALDSTLVFDAAATIVRGGDVPLWPPHPDFYATRASRVVYDGASSSAEGGQAGNLFGFEDGLVQETPGRLISYGTKSLHIWINVTGMRAAPGQEPTRWYLYFHNATGDWQAAGLDDTVNTTVDKKAYVFTVPVNDDGMDSPYAPDSRWEFVLRGTLDTPAFTCYGGCATYAVEYNMFILATNRVADLYSPVSDVT